MKGVNIRGGSRIALVGLLCGCLAGVSAGCGASKSVAAPSATRHGTKTKGCPSGTAGVNENGMVHCFGVGASSSTSGSVSAVPGEQASYQSNAHWPMSTNEAAQRYINAVVLYMNHEGGINFPKRSPLAFPLQWTTGLENGGGPSGSPIVLWQLSLPSSYLRWSASEWQAAMNILETQEFTGGGANVSMGVLVNSQGTAIDQVFQFLAPNGFVVRLVDGNSIPVNSVGITMPVPTEALVWSTPGELPGASMMPLWDEWIPPITEYPQLTTLGESHISAEMRDLKTSGQQIWQVLHPSSMAFSSPEVVPSSSPTTTVVPSTSGNAPSFSPSPSASPSPPPSSSANVPSSSTYSPSSAPNDLTVSAQDAPTGIQVSWVSSTSGDATPSQGCTVDLAPQNGSVIKAPLQNGGIVSGLTVGQTYGVQDVSCSDGAFGYGQGSIEYGMVATQLISLGISSSAINPNRDWLFVEYDKSLTNQMPSQNFADYVVTDTTTGVGLPVNSASLSGGELRIGVTIPAGVQVQSTDTIRLTTTAPVVTTQHGAPSLTDVTSPFN